ncbi:MAG: PPOX class F420-dependent oxidoreductase [Actinomycetota bacterium]
MDEDEGGAFLNHGTRTGKLSVSLPSGRPTVTPIWFIYEDDGKLRFNSAVGSPKVRAMLADPRACLLVDLEEPPYAFVKVDATVTIVDDNPELTRRVATAVGGRYMGADRAEEFGARNGGSDELVVELTPTKVTAVNDISG